MWAIIVGAVVLFAFSALWFTVLFGKTWSKLMGFTEAEMKSGGGMKSMTKPLVANFLLNILIAIVVSNLLPQLMSMSYYDFVKWVIIIWFGFSFPIFVNQALWERKSWKLVLLNSAQGVLAAVLVSAVIYYMR